jgi:hypothetical protein
MGTEQLNYVVDGRKYLLMEAVVTSTSKVRIEDAIKKYQCIQQGIKTIDRGGFWSNAFAVIKVLVPEENALEFSNRT